MVEDQSLVVVVVLPISVVVLMFSLGLGLSVADFRRVLIYPRAVAIGLANLILIAPLLALGIAETFALPAALAIGMVLLGASPGGAMACLLTHLARGDVALSVTMTAVSNVCSVATVPLVLGFAVDHFGSSLDADPEMLPIVARVFVITLIPIGAGMLLRARRPEWVARHSERARRVTLGVFVLAVIVAVSAEHDLVLKNLSEVAGATIALNLIAMTVGFTVAKFAKLGSRQATAIAMELGIHNATLAIAVASTISLELAIPAAVYSSFMFISAGVLARIMYGRNAPEIRSEAALATGA